MNKRQKFLFSSALLSAGLLLIQTVDIEFRYVAIFAFFLVTYIVSAFSLFDDLKGIEWFTILSLPSLYAVSVSLFYFLLPNNWWSQAIILSLFGLGLYALFLTENIYSVAASRTIQLLRAAYAVGFLLSIITLVLFYNTIFSLRLSPWINALGVMVVSLPIYIQGLWSVKLENKVDFKILFMSFGLSLGAAEVALGLSFLPATVWIASLFLGTYAYVTLGLMQQELSERLFSRTVYEYLAVGGLVLVASMMVMPWK